MTTTRRAPLTLYVDDFGALTTEPGPTDPASRLELFGLRPAQDSEALLSLAGQFPGVAQVIETAMTSAGVHDADWQDWLRRADASTHARIIDRVNDHLAGAPDNDDWDQADAIGATGISRALQYFREEHRHRESLSVTLVGAQAAGRAALLGMRVEEANAIAAREALAVRFAMQPC